MGGGNGGLVFVDGRYGVFVLDRNGQRGQLVLHTAEFLSKSLVDPMNELAKLFGFTLPQIELDHDFLNENNDDNNNNHNVTRARRLAKKPLKSKITFPSSPSGAMREIENLRSAGG